MRLQHKEDFILQTFPKLSFRVRETQAQTLKEFAGEDDYLYAEVWGVHAEKPKKIGYVVKERRPHMQFFHQAVGALLETENAGDDWKALQKSVDEETEIANVYREMFKPYDFNTKETSS